MWVDFFGAQTSATDMDLVRTKEFLTKKKKIQKVKK